MISDIATAIIQTLPDARITSYDEYVTITFESPDRDDILRTFRLTNLTAAVIFNDVQTIQHAITSGVDIDVLDLEESTPLTVATLLGNLAIVNMLIAAGARTSDNGIYAAALNHATLIIPLFTDDADIPTDVLDYVISMGYVETTRALIGHGSDINALTATGDTPLTIAAGRHDKPMVDLLIELGADVNAATSDGYTPLHYALQNRGNIAIANALVFAGADFRQFEPADWLMQ